MEIVKIPIAQLIKDPKNTRKHSPRNLEAIKTSLLTFGQQKPIVVDAGGTIIAGNGTLEAALSLGWPSLDSVRTELVGQAARAFAIADNQTAELAEWDQDELAKSLEEISACGDLDAVCTGFSAREIEQSISSFHDRLSAADPNQDDVPDEVESVAKTGDLWILGDHRLLCGDSMKKEDVERLLDGKKAALLSTDPPYCVNYTGMDRPIRDGKPIGKDWSHVYQEVDIKDLGQFLDGFFLACLLHLTEDAAVYIWHANRQQDVIAATFERHDLLLHQILVWVKPTATFGHSYYRWRHEPCAFGWKRGHKPKLGDASLNTVWEIDWEGKKASVGNEHPTQKPVRIFEIPIEMHTVTGDIVLELFCGSGSQLIAAEKLGRRCFAIEIQPVFVDVAVRRWEKFTGKKAEVRNG